MNKNYIAIGITGLLVLVLVVIITVVMLNENKKESYTYVSETSPPPYISFSTKTYNPKFPANREGSNIMIVDKNGNIDRMGFPELEGRLENMMKTMTDNVNELNEKINQVQWRVEDRATNLNNKINIFFPNGGKDMSIANGTNQERTVITNAQLKMLTGDIPFKIVNSGNEDQNKVLIYDRDDNNAKWHEDKFTTNPDSKRRGDLRMYPIA